MSLTHPHRLAAAGLAGITMLAAAGGVSRATPPDPAPPPIGVEELTRVDAETAVRGVTDGVAATLTVRHAGMDPMVLEVPELSNVAVARFTVQPGAQFPWHTHPGPVLVSVLEGELVYVSAEDCSQRSYPAGSAFVDPGRGMVHSARNPTDGETVLVAVFLEASADGPLAITEGVPAPAGDCAGPGPTTASGLTPPGHRARPAGGALAPTPV